MKLSLEMEKEELENTRVARFGQLTGTNAAFVDSQLPGGRKRNFKLVATGNGIFENRDMRPAIAVPHALNMSWVLIPPGGGSNLHDHPGSGAELFIPVDGPLTIYWGEKGDQELELEKFDLISVPEGLMRGFRNDTDHSVLMLAIVTGGEAGGSSVRWHPDVLRRAAEIGVHLDVHGKLVADESSQQ